MDVDVFMRFMEGALHAAGVKLSDTEWETVAGRLHKPLPKLSDGQLFAYIGGAGGVVMYGIYEEGETDLEEYANARPLNQTELGSSVQKLVGELRTNGRYEGIITWFEERHPPT